MLRAARPCATASSAPRSISTASVSDLIQSVEALQVLPVGEGQDDAVGDLEPLLLPHRVDPVHEVDHPPLELELGVEAGVERDRERALLRERPAVGGGALDEDLLRRELVPLRADAAVGEPLEPPGRERLAQGAGARRRAAGRAA